MPKSRTYFLAAIRKGATGGSISVAPEHGFFSDELDRASEAARQQLEDCEDLRAVFVVALMHGWARGVTKKDTIE